ncbi:MAG: hypothetical protein HOO67_07535 [Candidatus Peribacteraceae bacterium]|nr:hypothetical protein [Candidatus Peribacteraceae bacterium]
MATSDIKFTVPFEPRISRLFIFRGLWLVVEIWVLLVWSMWYGLIKFVHFWHMLILGKRNKALWNKEMRFARHSLKWQSYLMRLSNGRPEFIET